MAKMQKDKARKKKKGDTTVAQEIEATQTKPNADAESQTTETGTQNPQTSESEREGDSPDTGGSGKVDPFGRSVTPVAGETLSEDDQSPGPDEDKPQDELESPELAAVNIEIASATVSAQKKDGLSDEEIAEIVGEINSTFAKTADQGALEVGRFVLNKVFGGSLKDALSHNPKKDRSFKKITEHSDLACDPTTLARWVKAADLVRWFEDKGHKFSHLTCSHCIALLKVRNRPKLLVSLADETEKLKLSVRALKKAIAGPKPPIGVAEMLTKNLGSPGALVNDKQFKLLLDNKSVLGELSESEIKSALDKIRSKRELMQAYMSRITKLDAVLNEIREEKKRKSEEMLDAISKKAAAKQAAAA
jgi:hypothetical protein